MSSRPGIIAVIRQDADGTGATMGTTSGYSPTAYMPIITAEIRLHWPPRATREECLEALNRCVEQAMDRLDAKYEGDTNERRGS